MAGDALGTRSSVVDARIEALKAFKDWSNYLLVTTVAAIGWIARGEPSAAGAVSTSLVLSVAIWSLGISAVFGVFTLALVPLISEQMERAPDRTSIFTVPVEFFAGGSNPWTMYLTQSCRPQHLSFMLGVLLYCVAATGYNGPELKPEVFVRWRWAAPAILAGIFVTIAVRSHRRSVNVQATGEQERATQDL